MGSYESSVDLRRAFRQEILKAIFLFTWVRDGVLLVQLLHLP